MIDPDKIAARYKDGETAKSLAIEYGIPVSRLRNILSKKYPRDRSYVGYHPHHSTGQRREAKQILSNLRDLPE